MLANVEGKRREHPAARRLDSTAVVVDTLLLSKRFQRDSWWDTDKLRPEIPKGEITFAKSCSTNYKKKVIIAISVISTHCQLNTRKNRNKMLWPASLDITDCLQISCKWFTWWSMRSQPMKPMSLVKWRILIFVSEFAADATISFF